MFCCPIPGMKPPGLCAPRWAPGGPRWPPPPPRGRGGGRATGTATPALGAALALVEAAAANVGLGPAGGAGGGTETAAAAAGGGGTARAAGSEGAAGAAGIGLGAGGASLTLLTSVGSMSPNLMGAFLLSTPAGSLTPAVGCAEGPPFAVLCFALSAQDIAGLGAGSGVGVESGVNSPFEIGWDTGPLPPAGRGAGLPPGCCDDGSLLPPLGRIARGVLPSCSWLCLMSCFLPG